MCRAVSQPPGPLPSDLWELLGRERVAAAGSHPKDLTDPATLKRLVTGSRRHLTELGPRGHARDLFLLANRRPGDLHFHRRKDAVAAAKRINSIVLPTPTTSRASARRRGAYWVPSPTWLADYERSAKLYFATHPVDAPIIRDMPDGEYLTRLLGEKPSPRRGNPRALDPEAVRDAYRVRVTNLRAHRKTFLETGALPPVDCLPVFNDRSGQIVTIEHRTWPTRAAWAFLTYVIGESRTTLQTLIKPSRSK
jgi:hypothetical protein